MKALCWHGRSDVRIDTVPDPKIEDPTDVVVKITASGICGSDLHLYDGYMPTMKSGDILGHEPMGIVVEVGKSVTRLKKGDRICACPTATWGP
jgi:threonine dehydrogenase-like Zn-dependent dehydrogenase